MSGDWLDSERLGEVVSTGEDPAKEQTAELIEPRRNRSRRPSILAATASDSLASYRGSLFRNSLTNLSPRDHERERAIVAI